MSFDHAIFALEIFGVVVFAVSGALTAARKQMDILGFIVIAAVTGLGGGTLRDLVLGGGPVLWVREPIYVLLCCGAAVVTYFIAPFIASRLRVLIWADAIGLSVFAVLGTEAALTAGAAPVIAAMMGVITATFGGIIRDVICNEYPLLLEPEIYATAALAGSGTYLGVAALGYPTVATISGFVVALVIRGTAIAFGLRLPRYPSGPARRARPRAGERTTSDAPPDEDARR